MPNLDGALTQAVAELWLQGFTGGQIAAKLSHDLRRTITREAVMGRIHRLRQKHPGALEKRTWKPQPRHANMSKRVRKPQGNIVTGKRDNVPVRQVSRAVLVSPEPALPLVQLSLPSGAVIPWHSNRGCRYIGNDDPRMPAWCNAPVVPSSPWCTFHHQRFSVVARR